MTNLPPIPGKYHAKKKPWPNIGSCKKQAISADKHHSCDVHFWSWSFYSSGSGQWHITADMRDTRRHIVCNPLQPDTNHFHRWSGKYRVLSPVLFALYWQSIIRLEDGTKLLSPTPPRRHSTPNSSSARSNLTIFGPKGIFCEKIEKKCGDR